MVYIIKASTFHFCPLDLFINQIAKEKNCKAGRIWEIRKRVIGGNKNMEVNAVENPQNGKLVITKKDMKDVRLKYCKETLTKNQPEEGFREIIKT